MWWGLRGILLENLHIISVTHPLTDARLPPVSHIHTHARTQVVIFVKSVQRCIALAQLLVEQNFPAIAIHRGMPQEERWVRCWGRCFVSLGGRKTWDKGISTFFCFPFSQRLSRYQQFKDFQRRILVATNLFGRGMDIERVNIAFNYDMPEDSDTYLHRVNLIPRRHPCPLPPLVPLSSELMSLPLPLGVFLFWGLPVLSSLPF